jgi:Chemoreceptor zinc-binding domain
MGLKQDIEDAIQAHGAWKTKFRDYLSGKTAIDLDTVGESDCCKLGKWLEQEGRKLLPQKNHEEICKLHAKFHQAAAEVTRKIKQKDFAGARQHLAPDGVFNLASRTLTTCLLKTVQHNQQKSAVSSVAAEAKPSANSDAA